MSDTPIKILLIEDNAGDTRLIGEMLGQAGSNHFDLKSADRLSTGLKDLAEGGIDLILLDLSLPDSQGLDSLVRVRAEATEVPVVVLTGLGREELALSAVREGAQDYLVKGQFESGLLGRSILYAIERHRLQSKLSRSLMELSEQLQERKRSEETLRERDNQLLQSQKMEAIGRLAGGIAHDFNNLLTGIIGGAELLLTELEDDFTGRGELLQIREQAERAAKLTRQLLTFSRQHTMERTVFNLNSLLEDTLKMVKRTIGEDVDLRFVPEPDLGNIEGDRWQIEQVILNLAVNARDAMPRGGHLIFHTADVTIDEKTAGEDSKPGPGQYVMMSISDTGVGMDKATQERIFDPFFTTKEQGTGLGLSTVHGILKQHGSHIQVESEPREGTRFTVYFPCVEAPVEVSVDEEDASVEGYLPPGSETILLVEDEAGVRRTLERILRVQGYRVLSAAHPGEAEEIFAKLGKEIDLLFSDVVMPEMSGPELYSKLVQKHPFLKVLYISGYTGEKQVRIGPQTPFLQKPFRPSKLVQKVRQVLDSTVAKVLVVDDEPAVVKTLETFLKRKGCSVVTAFDGNDALQKVRLENPQVVLLDIRMPAKNGLEVLPEIKEMNKDVGVIMVTGVQDKEIGQRALELGAFDYIIKPFSYEYLEKVLWWSVKLMSL
ncbi:response regulator [Acidobacteria bacterium AH-259-A15]|nr:response regulator [Acidobacteria bacterium AH-259-A15]